MKHFLFDLDGTLGNTLPLCIQAFQESLQSVTGQNFSGEEISATFGPCELGTIRALAPSKETEALDSYLKRYRALHANWSRPFDGIWEIMDYLHERKAFIGLITSKGSPSTHITLKQYGMEDTFRVVKTGVPNGPIKDLQIKETLRDFMMRPQEVLYVGDSPIDIAASRAAGIRVAAAAWAPTSDADLLRSKNPDFLFTSVKDFYSFIRTTLHG